MVGSISEYAPSGELVEVSWIRVGLGTGNGTFGSTEYLIQNYVAGSFLAAADVNDDGAVDLVATGGSSHSSVNSVTVLLGDGLGSFGRPQTYPAGSAGYLLALAAADFNYDGSGRPVHDKRCTARDGDAGSSRHL